MFNSALYCIEFWAASIHVLSSERISVTSILLIIGKAEPKIQHG
jgi:hypothetical protein